MAEKPVAPATIAHEWHHPRLGRVRELLCDDHDQAVLSALRTLGIGSGGQQFSGEAECMRCAAAVLGLPPRSYVRTLTASGESL
jgi:hypothetical protein